jgi:nitroimidazol reductase NimA-like FMN-containing flavoprotein (pyridoxamine 5'-phosphate oxidase superfamily)
VTLSRGSDRDRAGSLYVDHDVGLTETMDHVEYTHTRGLDTTEVEEKLRTTETGVLALTDGTEAYAIPLSHYYDGQHLYFRLSLTADSKKARFIETTKTASYLLYGTEPTDSAQEIASWSVHISGTLRDVPEERYETFDTVEINRRFAPIRVFDEEIDEIEIALYESPFSKAFPTSRLGFAE